MRELSVKATLAFFALVGGALVIVGCKTSKSTPSSQAGETLADQTLAAIARSFASNWNHTLPKSGHRIDQRVVYPLMNGKDANSTIFLQEKVVATGKAKIVLYADGHIEYRK